MDNRDTLSKYKDEFLNLPRDDDSRLYFLMRAWAFFNKKYFKGQLKVPIVTVEERGLFNSFEHLDGAWQVSTRILFVSPKAFVTWDSFSEVLRHEMCHQAVSDIDKKPQGKNGGHGAAWARWMKKVGLDPHLMMFHPQQDILDILTPQQRPGYLRSITYDNAHRNEILKPGKVYKFGRMVRTWDIKTWKLTDFIVVAYGKEDGHDFIAAVSKRNLVEQEYTQLSPTARYYKAKSEPSDDLKHAAKYLKKHLG